MKKNLIITTILLVLMFSGCSEKTTYIKVPCKYPTLTKVPTPAPVKITGFKNCKALKNGKWIEIGACIDYKNALLLKAQSKKYKRIITTYEAKIDTYNKTIKE